MSPTHLFLTCWLFVKLRVHNLRDVVTDSDSNGIQTCYPNLALDVVPDEVPDPNQYQTWYWARTELGRGTGRKLLPS